MINKIKSQTLQPDHIYLTLSTEEFPNKELDLPDELKNEINEWFTINWVDKNTKNMKKIFPILKYLNDDDIILNLDDDMLNIPIDLFESRIFDFYSNGKKFGITPNDCKSKILPNESTLYYWASGCCSVVSKKMYNGWEVFCSDDVINCFEDDRVYSYLILLNNYTFKLSSKYLFNFFVNNLIVKDDFGNNSLKIYDAQNTIKILNDRFLKIKKSQH